MSGETSVTVEADQVVVVTDTVPPPGVADVAAALALVQDSRTAIDNRFYPGVQTDLPATRPDGSDIQEGDRCFLGTDDNEYIYRGAAWVNFEAAAAQSAADAESSRQAIDSRMYPGAYANDPTTRPDGTACQPGDEYFNSTSNLRKRFNGATWVASDINTANLAASTGANLVGSDDASGGTRWTSLAGFVSFIRSAASALFGRVNLLAGTATNLLIRDQTAGNPTRVHIEPNGHVAGTASKLDWMFDPYATDPVSYRILNAYPKTYSPADASTTQGNNGVAVMGVKGVGHHWGIWPAWHFGYSDDGAGAAVPMKLYYFDTSDTVWRTPMKGGWRAGVAVSFGDYMLANNKLYQSGTTGVTGAAAPSHSVGSASDGVVDWTFVRDFAAAAGSIKACVVFGDRDDLPKFGLPGVRVQYAGDAAVWNGKKVHFLDSSGAIVWNVYAPVGTDDLYIESADGARRLRLDATGQFLQIAGLAIAGAGTTAANGDTTPSIKGVDTLLLSNTGATLVTQFDDGVAHQRIFVRAGNGNTTLVHGVNMQLKGGVSKTLALGEALLFLMSTNGAVAHQV